MSHYHSYKDSMKILWPSVLVSHTDNDWVELELAWRNIVGTEFGLRHHLFSILNFADIYDDILNEAVKIKSSCEQICYVAAFVSSSYASIVYRTGKPFNPLLGETYECDRRCEMGWRSLTEQVSDLSTSQELSQSDDVISQMTLDTSIIRTLPNNSQLYI